MQKLDRLREEIYLSGMELSVILKKKDLDEEINGRAKDKKNRRAV